MTYNMATTACWLEDVSDTPDPKSNEHLHETKWLPRVALEH